MAKMGRYIQLQDIQNTTIDVNPDHIEMMKPSPGGDTDFPGLIQWTSGKAMKVKQTVDQIKELIRQAGQRQAL
jgi:uncharacterized protein YlzI (FlbEa/FlbD family)